MSDEDALEMGTNTQDVKRDRFADRVVEIFNAPPRVNSNVNNNQFLVNIQNRYQNDKI